MSDNEFVFFFFKMMLVVITLSVTITLSALCVMLLRNIYRDWDKL
jgi:hypothetical protein